MQNKILIGIAIALVAFLVGYSIKSSPSPLAGGVDAFDVVSANSLRIGSGCGSTQSPCTGTTMSQVMSGTCNLVGMDVSHAATTSKAYDCAITGIVSGDKIFATMATTSAGNTFQGWRIAGATASSTSGFATLSIYNGTGAAVTVPSSSQVGSSTQYLIIR